MAEKSTSLCFSSGQKPRITGSQAKHLKWKHSLRKFAHAIYRDCHLKILDILNIFAQNIDCGYTLEPPRQGGSNEYPQSMFWSKN